MCSRNTDAQPSLTIESLDAAIRDGMRWLATLAVVLALGSVLLIVMWV